MHVHLPKSSVCIKKYVHSTVICIYIYKHVEGERVISRHNMRTSMYNNVYTYDMYINCINIYIYIYIYICII